jgi:hypothetical protein
MANSRIPGSTGLHPASIPDDGSLAHLSSPQPGVTGLDDCRPLIAFPSPPPAADGTATGRSAEDQLIERLQGRAGFTIAGDRFRIIRADQWPLFRSDTRYEIVSPREARRLLEELAAAPMTAFDERTALEEAVSVLADTDRRVLETGLLLLRIRTVAGGGASASTDPPVTPSQLARSLGRSVDEPRQDQPPTPPPPLSFYEVIVLDELENAIAGVEVELTTPKGTEILLTDASGRVRVDDAPAGTGTTHIVSGQQLLDVLRDRVSLDTRRTPLPEGDLLIVTPKRVDTSVSFPDATTQRIMVVNRTDVVWGSVVEHWGDLLLLSEEDGPSRLVTSELTAMLRLSSTGAGPSALLGLPPSGVDLRDEANRDITGNAITDRLDQNARLTIDIDALHEALFTADFAAVDGLIDPAAEEPPPAPPPPDFPVPSAEGIDFAAELALLALQGTTDLPTVPEAQV